MRKNYFYLVVLAIPAILLLQSNNNGSPGGKSGSPGDQGATCAQCHTGTVQTASNWISTDIPFTGYIPGQTYTITATATHSGAAKIGFELTVENSQSSKVGTLAITEPTRTKLVNGNKSVTHTASGNVPSGNSNTWTVNWTAPAMGAGQVGFYAAFNAANGNGTTSGDVVYKSSSFANQAASASLLSIQPDEAFQGASLDATISGQNTNWSSGSVTDVSLVNSSNPLDVIVATSFTVTNATTLLADFDIPASASTGFWNVMVDDLSLNNAFTVLLPTSIDEGEIFANFNYYPVPAKDILNLEGVKGAKINIFNISGSNLVDIEKVSEYQSVDVSALPEGVYFLRVTRDGLSRTEKIIISH